MPLPNPFTMAGTLERCWLFAYRTTEAAARRHLSSPGALWAKPVLHGGHAYWSVVVCRIRGMRPLPLPRALGISYWHVAYRLYARVRLESGEEVEGLYFLRSDCDSRLIAAGGNLLTDFRFHTARVEAREEGPRVTLMVESPEAPGHAVLRRDLPVKLPAGSPFPDVPAAVAALKYHPVALSPAGPERVVLLPIGRDEAAWHSRAVHVEHAAWGFLLEEPAELELCVEVDPIDYRWLRPRPVGTRRRTAHRGR